MKKINLLWLTKDMIDQELCGEKAGQHSDLDDREKTKTEFNIFQRANVIITLLYSIDRGGIAGQKASLKLREIKDNDTTVFSSTPEFMDVCAKLDINIPFNEINEHTYSDSIMEFLKNETLLEGTFLSKESR